MPNKDRTIKTLRLLGTKDLVLFSLQTLRMSQESSFQKYLHTAGGSLSTVSFPGLFCLVEWQLQFFFGDAVCCVHLWSKSSSPKISRALVFLFSCSFINKRTASNYQFSFFFSEKRYVAFICFHERSLTKWNNAKIPKISTRIFSMPRPANRERLSTPRTTSEFIAFCQRMKQPDYIYDTKSIAWRNVIDIE